MRPLTAITMLFLILAIPAMAKPVAPRPAPEFALPGRNGIVSLDSLRGKVVLADFWASWCEPCRKSFPWMADLYRRRSSEGLAIVAINLDKQRDLADAFLAQHPVPFDVAFDPAGKTAEAFGVKGMPTSVLIDRNGVIVESHVGWDPRRAARLETLIQEVCSK
jgi:thiol-disulfide isomerase/thioredoxin